VTQWSALANSHIAIGGGMFNMKQNSERVQ